MTRVGWLADDPGFVGGAERSQAEFRAAAPDGVEIVSCYPGNVNPDCDVWVIHNCVFFKPEDLGSINGPMFKMWHDVGPHIVREQWEKLSNARFICVSPRQREWMGLEAELIPPAIPLERFREAAESAGERKGAVAVGSWNGPGKAPDAAAAWAKGNGGISFYGDGQYAPPDSSWVDYKDLPEVLARYKTYVHLPRDLEPFGRCAVEAWAAGCEVIVNNLVGARYWISEAPEKLESAAEDFWRLVLSG